MVKVDSEDAARAGRSGGGSRPAGRGEGKENTHNASAQDRAGGRGRGASGFGGRGAASFSC